MMIKLEILMEKVRVKAPNSRAKEERVIKFMYCDCENRHKKMTS